MEQVYKNNINKLFTQIYKADNAKDLGERLQILTSDHDCHASPEDGCEGCKEIGNIYDAD